MVRPLNARLLSHLVRNGLRSSQDLFGKTLGINLASIGKGHGGVPNASSADNISIIVRFFTNCTLGITDVSTLSKGSIIFLPPPAIGRVRHTNRTDRANLGLALNHNLTKLCDDLLRVIKPPAASSTSIQKVH
jgi:hypothetical protein